MENTYEKYKWNEENYIILIDDLKSLADMGYKKFNSNLLPNTENMLGIRVPVLRKIAKDISKGNWRDYFEVCKDNYFEETMLQGFVLNYIKAEVDEIIKYMDKFIVKIDNWATCDTFCNGMKIVKKNQEIFHPYIQNLVISEKEFSIRTGLVLLLAYYINEEYIDGVFAVINAVEHENYYVKMANAWLIASCFSKFRDKTLQFLNNNHLDNWTYNKAIQKILESKTTAYEDKQMLKKFKI